MVNNREDIVYLGINQEAKYPTNEKGYSPKVEYPEYVFGKTHLSVENQVYEMVRKGFYFLGYDQVNYGTKVWNPLGEFIHEGDTVLIKPNWVMHYNKNKDRRDDMECLVTHPSVVRVVIDYVLIALRGTGKVVVADAPMQGCDLNILFSKAGYIELFKFYKDAGVNLEVLDLRQCRVITKMHVITETIVVNGEEQSTKVDLGEVSKHWSNRNMQFKVSDYTIKKTNFYHHDKTHIYNINKIVLAANVIINMPKPKSHRLAGLTAAQKNVVGIVYDKACLPHRVIGATTDEGDEYYKKSIIKLFISGIEEKKLELAEKGKSSSAIFLQLLVSALYLNIRTFYKDKAMIGSWYGNNTIWKTVSDLNFIMKYVDKNGALFNMPQRRIINIADMIVSGQGNGPIGPYPKNLGMILIGEEPSNIDAICAKIMGFDMNKIPGLNITLTDKKTGNERAKIIYSNKEKYNKLSFDDFVAEKSWRFEPHDCWKGFIEGG